MAAFGGKADAERNARCQLMTQTGASPSSIDAMGKKQPPPHVSDIRLTKFMEWGEKLCPNYSGLMPANLITLAHFSGFRRR